MDFTNVINKKVFKVKKIGVSNVIKMQKYKKIQN
jgi:hypothetical protein